MESGAAYLRDIHGLDTVPWWPLAPGWWLLVGVIMVVGIVAMLWYTGWLRRDPLAGWRRDARRKLRALRRRARKGDLKEIAGTLSELLRRIAILRCSRQDCAGLSGDDWLEWLGNNDPNAFKWQERGRLLLAAPYAPPGFEVKRRELVRLIDAALRWVDASKPADVAPAQATPESATTGMVVHA